MTKISKSSKKLLGAIFSIVALCLTLMFGVFINSNPVYAISEKITKLSNLDFSSNSITTSVYTNPTSWTKGLGSNTTSGTINLNYYNKTNLNLSVDQVPQKLEGFDDYVLMINSNTASDTTPKAQYYTNSSSLTLDPYSTYRIKTYVQVTNGARASIYVTGLEDELCFEGISYNQASTWVPYNFYITTGLNSEQIKLELWLGSKQTNTSNGAVFFDNIEITQISEKDVEEINPQRTIYKNLKSNSVHETFENDLSKWSRINELEENTYAEIINLSNNNESEAKNISYVGTDYSKDSNKALVLYTKEDTKSYFGYKSEPIDLKMYEIEKITVNVKVADLTGSAYVKIVENEVKNANDKVIEQITPANTSLSVTSNSSNKFNNYYQTLTFFVKGRSLYNTSYNIELWLGSESNKSSGIVAFDSITREYVSYSDYEKATTGSTVAKLELQSNTDSFEIKNSAFNNVQKQEKELTYPLIPSDWTHSEKDSQENHFGVINTNASVYNESTSQFGNFANPGNPEGFGDVTVDTNNILLMHNINETYQSIKSSSFKIESNSYYKLTFAYKLIATDATQKQIFNVYVQDDANNILYTEENITSTNGWAIYTVYFNTKAYSNELNLILSLGTENKLVKGIAYIDNVILQKEELTSSEYEEIVKENNVLDFQEGNFNLIKENSNGIHTPLRYTQQLEKGNQVTDSSLDIAFGGIIDASNTHDAYEIEKQENSLNTLDYIMMIQTMDQAKYSLTAKDNLELSANSYYKFTIDIKTQGLEQKDQTNSEEKYGAIFALSGIEEKLDGIVANNWTTYTIYVSSTTSTTVKLQFALESLDIETSGIAYFDNYSYEVIDSDTYNSAVLNNEGDDKILFIGDTDVKEEDTDDTSSTTDLNFIWYLIPTLLLAIALVLALVSYLMKKFKVKKWEKKKINSYDREKTVYRDVIRFEAEKRRDEKVKEIQNSISELEKEKAHMEEVHKEQLNQRRASRQKGVSFNIEREFKQYAKMHTAIENRISNLNKQIESLNSAEYLLNLQHKIAIEKARKERESLEKNYEGKKQKKSKK